MRKYNNCHWGLIIIFIAFTSCKLSRFVFYNFADIKDYRIFPSRQLQNDSTKFIFPADFKEAPKLAITAKYSKLSFERYLKNNKTVAFIIIHNDTIKYEKYFSSYDKASVVPSFSMAKSITSILIGCAIDEGFIKSVEEPITNYIPQLKKNGLDKVRIRNLLQMTSGIKFNESYTSPFGDAATYYYGRNLRKKLYHLKLRSEPNKQFEYISVNTELLGLILENALKTKTISDYLQEKIWKPLGMEYSASWSLDQKKNGIEKTYCCINAPARDFAKIGRLYMNSGNWNGKQIVSAKWVMESTKIDTSSGSAWFYQYQWWLPSAKGDFMAEGILGQFIYVNPLKNLIIVRLGKKYGNINWGDFFTSIASEY